MTGHSPINDSRHQNLHCLTQNTQDLDPLKPCWHPPPHPGVETHRCKGREDHNCLHTCINQVFFDLKEQWREDTEQLETKPTPASARTSLQPAFIFQIPAQALAAAVWIFCHVERVTDVRTSAPPQKPLPETGRYVVGVVRRVRTQWPSINQAASAENRFLFFFFFFRTW